jgi:WD40 repeat protein
MKSPFKFLDSYTKDDHEIFFGRDREIEELYQRVFESKLLLVYGVSGTGKSSLIHCGLANKFQETDWLPLIVRRAGNLPDNLASVIKSASVTQQSQDFVTSSQFKKAVRSLYLDHYKPVFFIFDQFEELFIFGTKEEKHSFVEIIRELINSDIQCRFIFVLREEYLANITEFEKYIPTILANRVHIEKMSHINAVEAIKGPCKVFNISLEEGFAEILLEKLSPGSGEIELTYLQVFLDKIFRLAVSKDKSGSENRPPSFTLNLIQKTGDVSDLLGGFLEEQISLLDDPDSALVLLKSLVSVKGTKRPMSPEEIREHAGTFGNPIEESVLLEMLQTFIHLRILRDKDQNGKYELRHDALAVKIYEKFTLVEKELLEVRKYVENAFYTYETRGILLNREDLDYLASYERKLILPQNLSDFITQSRKKLHARRKALARMTYISALIFVLIIAAIGRTYFRKQGTARSSNLIGYALLQSEANPLKSLSSSFILWGKDSLSPVLQRIIIKGFQSLLSIKTDSSSPIFLLQQDLLPIKLESKIENANISDNGKYIFGWMENNRVFVLDILTNGLHYFKTDGDPIFIDISENDSLVALICSNNKGVVCDFMGNAKYSFVATSNNVMNERLFSFFPSGEYQLVTVKDNEALIYDKTGKITFELKGHTGKVNSVDVSPDGRFVATASSDNRVYLWNYNQERKLFSIYDSLIGHKSTVWSCCFNRSGKYVITASADSTVKIWDLNGREINPEFSFGRNYEGFARYKYNAGEYDEDALDKALSIYYRKNCNARFSPNEREIIATSYSVNKDSLTDNRPEYSQVLYYDYNSEFYTRWNYPFFESVNKENNKIDPVIFRKLIVSPSEDIAAAEVSKINKIYLLSRSGLCLITIDGNCPMFSNDGKDFSWIYNNEIKKIPVTSSAIKNLLEKYKLTESSKGADDILIVL